MAFLMKSSLISTVTFGPCFSAIGVPLHPPPASQVSLSVQNTLSSHVEPDGLFWPWQTPPAQGPEGLRFRHCSPRCRRHEWWPGEHDIRPQDSLSMRATAGSTR